VSEAFAACTFPRASLIQDGRKEGAAQKDRESRFAPFGPKKAFVYRGESKARETFFQRKEVERVKHELFQFSALKKEGKIWAGSERGPTAMPCNRLSKQAVRKVLGGIPKRTLFREEVRSIRQLPRGGPL